MLKDSFRQGYKNGTSCVVPKRDSFATSEYSNCYTAEFLVGLFFFVPHGKTTTKWVNVQLVLKRAKNQHHFYIK